MESELVSLSINGELLASVTGIRYRGILIDQQEITCCECFEES